MLRLHPTPRRPTLWFPQVAAWAAVALATCALHSTAPAQTGTWSPVASWETGGVPLHLALVRGDGSPFHSRIVWWGTTLYQDLAGGGVIGWRADGLGCGTFPDTTGTTPTFDPLHPWGVNENLFCSALTQLADGKLYSLGGSYPNSAGLRSAWTYDGSSGGTNLGTWARRDSMAQHRWYPTAISLRDGRMFVSAGHKYAHLWSYGGRRDGATPSVQHAGHLLDRTGRIIGGNWDSSIEIEAAVPNDGRPTPREGHTLQYLPVLGSPVLFGGRDSTGVSANDAWYLARGTGGVLEAAYHYFWHKLGVVGTAPAERHEHTAVAVSGAEMIVWGGARKTSGGSETPRGDLWRLYEDGSDWKWQEITASGAPSARLGHAAVYDTHTFVISGTPTLVRRLVIYGGTTPGNAATDLKVYIFTFGSDFTSGTWSNLTPSGAFDGSAPGPRYDHTMTLTPHPYCCDRKRIAWVFGGRLGTSSTSDTLWRLTLGSDDPTNITWEYEVPEGTPPGGLVGHTAFYDPSLLKLTFVGGSTATPPDRRLFQISSVDLPYIETIDSVQTVINPDWEPGGEGPVSLAGHAIAIDPNTLGATEAIGAPVFARTPEIFNPATNTWTTLPGAARAPDYYPVQFVVPRIPFRADTCRVLEVNGAYDGSASPSRYLDIASFKTGPTYGGSGQFPFRPPSGVMYRPGKILVGGGAVWNDRVPAAKLDVTDTVGWQPAGDMYINRRNYLNMVTLPTGDVLAVGGAWDGLTDTTDTNAAKIPDLWSPATNTWTALSGTDAVMRNYHSTALLLPDGRVLTGGGWPPAFTTSHRFQLFCPPYLFKNDNTTLAPRRVIQGAPTSISWRQVFTLCVDDTAGIRSACLIRPAATTHGLDMNQRFVPLTINGHAGNPQRLFLTAPASPDSAPPGDYMLFVNGVKDGATYYPDVPSLARWVRVQPVVRDSCDVVAPTTIADFEPAIVGSNSVSFTWTGPGDDDLITASGAPTAFTLSGSTDESTPGLAGSPGSGSVTGLSSCSWHYFTLSTWDDNQNESGVASLSVKTTCGGGGGGEEQSARGDVVEAGAGAPPLAMESSRRGPATPTSASELGPASGTLVVETRQGAGGGWEVSMRLQEPPASASGSAVTVEGSDEGSGRDTLGRFALGTEDNLLGLCSLRDGGRLGVPGVYRLEQLVPHLRARGGDYLLDDAWHSRLGTLESGVSDSAGIELAVGDSLTLSYTPAPDTLADVASGYALVRRTSSAPPSPMGARPGLSGTSLPSRFALYQNRPNPFRGTTVIAFDLPVESPVRIEVFDLLGRRVASLVNTQYSAGSHSVEWDLRDSNGTRVGPGVYIYRLSAGTFHERRKMSVLR